jgi:hypothetical protein
MQVQKSFSERISAEVKISSAAAFVSGRWIEIPRSVRFFLIDSNASKMFVKVDSKSGHFS